MPRRGWHPPRRGSPESPSPPRLFWTASIAHALADHVLSEVGLAALAAKASRRAAAFQPPEVILINPAFRTRIEAIAARRVVTANTVTTSRPLAAG